MKTIEYSSNDAILKAIGENLERLRIEAQIPDSDVIRNGGIKKDSWYNLKAGRNVTLLNLIKALRGLNQLTLLETLSSNSRSPSPMDQVRESSMSFPKRIRRPSGRPVENNRSFKWGDEE
ncbi:MAG: hypothetical protein DRZ90_09440 [Spirochaetes bacterium]|nr:MAG: hypothetical protein DRP60_07200 [Spirochaetota bacterium]RKX96028.1 MAG: hypothetical protein DRZ90_09440 [Spirochaetota bacterium]